MTETHPSEDSLRDYCRGEANDKLIEDIETHIADCIPCARTVARIVSEMQPDKEQNP